MFVKQLKIHFPNCRIVATVHDQGWTSPLLGKKELLREILMDEKCPEIVSQKTFNFIKSYSNEEKELYKLCSAIVALSESAYDTFTEIYGVEKSKVFMIHNCIEDVRVRRNIRVRNKMREKFGIDPNIKVLLYAGRPVKSKGFEVLLKAFEILHDYRSDVRLVVAGRLSDVAKTEHLFRNVAPWTILLGLISRSEVKPLYPMADIGILPSFTEQCSFSGLEMMANRLPVVASDGYCVTDMFVEGLNAEIVHIPENPLEDDSFALRLALGMKSLLEEKTSNINKMLSASTNRVKSIYSPELFAEKYSSMLNSI